jgi:hypothetical protein
MSEDKRKASDRPEGPTNASELLTHQFGTVYALIERNTAGMSHADSLVQPQPTGNCANWILAHLTVVHNTLMGLLGESPVWDHQRLTLGTLYEPIEREEQAFDWDTMRSRFVASRDRCLAALTRLTPEALARRMTGPFGDPTTMAGLLGTLAVHQTYHAGQLAVSRRVAGLEGAVKAPGQES